MATPTPQQTILSENGVGNATTPSSTNTIASPLTTKQQQVNDTTERKQIAINGYESMEQFDRLNPNASYNERALIQANVIERGNQISTTLGEDAIDALTSAAATATTILPNQAATAIDLATDPVGSVARGSEALIGAAHSLFGKEEEFEKNFKPGYEKIKDFVNQARESSLSFAPAELVTGALSDISNLLAEFSGSVGELKEEELSSGFKARRAERIKQTEEQFAEIDKALPKDASATDVAMSKISKVATMFDNFSGEELFVLSAESAPYLLSSGRASKKGRVQASKDVTSTEITKAGSLSKAIEAKKAKGGAQAATANVAVLEGSSAAVEAKNEVLAMEFSQLEENSPLYRDLLDAGMQPEAAREEVARQHSTGTGTATGILAAGANIVSGGVGEKTIGKALDGSKATVKGVLKKGASAGKDVLASAASETVEEAIVGGGGKIISNISKATTADETQEALEGAETGAIEGGIVGGISGGGTTATVKGVTSTVRLPSNILKARAERRAEAPKTAPTETVSPTPVNDTVIETEETLAPVEAIKSDSAEVNAVKETAQTVRNMAKDINERVANLNPEEANLGELLQLAAQAQQATSALYQHAVDAAVNTETTPKVKAELDNVISQLENPNSDSIIAALGKEIQQTPALASTIDAAFKAITTGDTTELNSMLGAIEGVGKTGEVTQSMTDALMQTALYSIDFTGDDSITVEQLKTAAEQTTGAVSQRYTDIATIKDIDSVANEVIDGTKEFTGINTHLRNLKQAVSKGDVGGIGSILSQLASFSNQRSVKAEALEKGIADAQGIKFTPNNAITITWGKQGKHVISSAGSLQKTVELAEQVRKEETLVQGAVQAAENILSGDINEAQIQTPETEAVSTESKTDETDGEGAERSPTQIELDFSEPTVEAEEFIKEVSENTELKNRPTEDEFAKSEDTAIAEATDTINLEIEELRNSRTLRQNRLKTVTEKAKTNDAFLPEIERATAAIATVDAEINQAEARRDVVVSRTRKQHQLDWDLGIDPTKADTKSKQLTSLVKDVLGSLTGKRAIKSVASAYNNLDITKPKEVTQYLRDLTVDATEGVLNFVNGLSLTLSDRAVVTKLMGASNSIVTAPNALKNTLGSLKQEFNEQYDLGLDNENRYKKGVIAYRESRLWEDTDYLTELASVENKDDLIELGFDVSKMNERDIDVARGILSKRAWFFDKFARYNKKLLENLKNTNQNMYDQSKLRYLLGNDGKFPTKVVDAAFMAYMHGTQSVGESIYNDDTSLMSLLGLSDKSLLGEVNELDSLRLMGTPVTTKAMTGAFKQAMGLQHAADLPQSVTDSVHSAMGGMLFNILKSDNDFLTSDVVVNTDTGRFSYTGFTLNTENSHKAFHEIHANKAPVTTLTTEDNFSWLKSQAKNLLNQISKPIDDSPTNWVGVKPPKVTTADTHIRSSDKLTDDQVEAENISRNVAHILDPAIVSLHKQLGIEGFKKIKGYVEDTTDLNAEHKLSVNGKNQEITDSYDKADKLINDVDAAENKEIYFEGAFSSVRRQQRKGAVNDQGDKYHRALIGLKNNAVIKSLNLNKLNSLKKGTNGYNFILALGQAYGLDVDKQANSISFNEMVNGTSEFTGLIDRIQSDSLESDIASRMIDGQLQDGSMTSDIVTALTGKSDHEIQGIITVARLIAAQDNTGKVINFSHYMKAEVDGLTNGPAHSTFMNGLAGLSPEESDAALARGGYLVGSGKGNNTHVRIGEGTITDSYITVAKVANSALDKFFADIDKDVRKGKQEAINTKAAYEFLSKRKVAIAGEFEGNKLVGLKLTRNGTKNPVTVTVYGGGAAGIHAKMASELRTLFAEEITQLIKTANAGELKPSTLRTMLEGWSQVFYGDTQKLPLIKSVKKVGMNRDALIKVLTEFKFQDDFKKQSVNRTRDLYGKFATDAIDVVFKSNKRSAALMNASLNFLTTQINNTFEKAYTTLHKKRVDEKAIREFDTLSSKDIGLIQRKLEEMYPQLRTAVGDTTNIAKEGQDRVAEVGVAEVRYPSLTAKTPSPVKIHHSAKNMALPGVRAIPVLTISIDAAVQINNHLLQGKKGNFLNVLDAIDRIADSNLRASNEVFNVAEYMGIMQQDTLATVQEAVVTAIKAQTQPVEIEGIEILPTLSTVDINDGDARLELSQEVLRQSVRDIKNPIANALGLSPVEIGNTTEFLQYLLKQLNTERHNNKLARDNFIFGNPEVAINQMAGIDDGHAKVVNGQVVLSKKAEALLDEDGKERLTKFNDVMALRYAAYKNTESQDRLVKESDTEIEVLRKRIEADPEDEFAIEQVNNILSPLTGLWQDLRGTFNLDTNTFTYKLTGSNKAVFKRALSPEVTGEPETDTDTGVTAAIPTVGKVISDMLGFKTTKGKGKSKKVITTDYFDTVLKDLEVQVTPEVTEDFPASAKGSYRTEVQGKKTVRIIKIREGLTTEEANVVLAHELIHAVTQGGIHEGLTNKGSIEHTLTQDLWKQLQRALKFMEGQPAEPESIKYIRKLNAAGEIELALNEYIAYIGSERKEYAGFLATTVNKKNTLSTVLQDLLNKSWKTVKDYLAKKFFGKNEDVNLFIAKREKVNTASATESDVLAHILAGLGRNNIIKADTTVYSTNLAKETLTATQNVIKSVEGQSDAILNKGMNLVIESTLRGMGRLGIGITTEGAQDYINMTPEQREANNKRYIDRVLTGKDENERTGFIRSTFGEFFARSSNRSQTLDEHNDKAKHEADAEREYSKEVIAEDLEAALENVTDEENRAIHDVVIRGDLFSFSNDTNVLRNLLDNPAAVTDELRILFSKIQALPNVSQKQKNIMINEATTLGARSITGGAYEGLNLPNAKAIVAMSGTSVSTPRVDDPTGSIEKLVDDIATLTGIQTLTDADRENMSKLLVRNPEAMKYVADTHANVIRKIGEQYGEGKLLGLPKGFIPDQVNPNRAIKVVPWKDRNKFKGYHFEREFIREVGDLKSQGNEKRMALLISKEGGVPPYVQGAMSTIEAAIGGFTTQYGSATDKSLPVITDEEVLATNARKSKLADLMAQRIRAPKQLKEGLIPNINSVGATIGYRYAIDHREREQFLETSHDVADVLSAYDARIGEQQIAEKFNKELVDQLKAAYDDERLTDVERKEQFVTVHAGSDDPQVVEAWRVIPQHTKAAIKEKFGGNFVYVHKRDFDNALGYREWSVSKLWSDNLKDGSKRKMFVDIADAILGDDAVNKLRFAERILQETVVAAKDLIVVKSIVVPVANAFSNAYHLLVLGVSPQDIIKGYKEAGKGLAEFKQDIRALKRAEHEQEVTGKDNSELIAELEDKLNKNPIKFMVDAGLLSTVIEDTTKVTARGTAKEATLDKFVPDILKQQDNIILDIGKNLLVTQDSWTYNKLSNGLELGDFGAKYIQYRQLRSDGVSQQDALDRVRVEFVNYNTLSNRQLDYANKVGGVFFFKYFARIQSIILRTIKENPTRALTAWSGLDTIGMPSVFEAMILDKDITHTTGAYDLLNMAGGAHPLTGL